VVFTEPISTTTIFQPFSINNFFKSLATYLLVAGIQAWEECNWINKIIKINNIYFKVEKNIPRCVAINLKPKTDDNTLNLLKSLKKTYNHFDMGIYLTALSDGKIDVGHKVEVNQ
jgi:uncharacterized protein YcbX